MCCVLFYIVYTMLKSDQNGIETRVEDRKLGDGFCVKIRPKWD